MHKKNLGCICKLFDTQQFLSYIDIYLKKKMFNFLPFLSFSKTLTCVPKKKLGQIKKCLQLIIICCYFIKKSFSKFKFTASPKVTLNELKWKTYILFKFPHCLYIDGLLRTQRIKTFFLDCSSIFLVTMHHCYNLHPRTINPMKI